MICKTCGAHQPDSVRFCSACGLDLQPAGPQVYAQPQYQNPEAVRAADTAFICGIIGLFVIGLILGIIAVVQARKAKRLGYTDSKASTGFVLGVVAIVINVLSFVGLVLAMGLMELAAMAM